MRMRFDLCHSQSVACRLVTEPSEISFAPSAPRIYNSYTLLEPTGKVGAPTLLSMPNDMYQRLFLATLTSSSITDLRALAKLVYCSYSREVHKYLTDNGLAPKMYGCAEVDGAPTAYAMEYLDPSTWQTLYKFYDSTRAKVVDPQPRTAPNTIVKTLESKNMFTKIFEPM